MRKKKSNDSNNGVPSQPQPSKAPPAVSPAASKPASKPRASAAPKAYAVIDHPMEGEIVRSRHYTVRAGASATNRVEISINGKEWMPMRFSVGFWWFDWHGYGAGAYEFEIRAASPTGRYAKSKPRRFTVLI